MSGNGREMWVWFGRLPAEYTQINHNITNTDFVLKIHFPELLNII